MFIYLFIFYTRLWIFSDQFSTWLYIIWLSFAVVYVLRNATCSFCIIYGLNNTNHWNKSVRKCDLYGSWMHHTNSSLSFILSNHLIPSIQLICVFGRPHLKMSYCSFLKIPKWRHMLCAEGFHFPGFSKWLRRKGHWIPC